MKNFVILVLLVAVCVLGYLFYKSRRAGIITAGGGITKKHRTPGGKHQRTDRNNKTVNTQECDLIINDDTCVIPISYLRKMTQPGGNDDYALEVRHGDKIIWFGDGGESLDVQPLRGVACPGSTAPPAGTSLLYNISQPGVLQIGVVAGDPNNDDQVHDHYCYKTTVNIAGQPPIDPHMFDAGTP